MSAAVTLPSGQHMPLIGLGTWQAKPEEVENAVLEALQVGYRHIDTAFIYHNEGAIGRAIKTWMTTSTGHRNQLFIVTKLPHFGNRASDVEKYLTTSLERLQLDYVDMYLIHMPFGFMPNTACDAPAQNEDGSFVLDTTTDHVAVWKAMEVQVDKGRAKAIGISNFNCSQIQRIIENARIKPSCVQVELHAYHQQRELRELLDKLAIQMTAYSSLGSPGAKSHFMNKYHYSPDQFPDLMNDPVVARLATKYEVTPAQILLRHLVQQGIAVIPKSTNPARIKQNFQIFDFKLAEDEMKEMDNLDRGNGKARILDFRFFKGVEKHPEYPFKQ